MRPKAYSARQVAFVALAAAVFAAGAALVGDKLASSGNPPVSAGKTVHHGRSAAGAPGSPLVVTSIRGLRVSGHFGNAPSIATAGAAPKKPEVQVVIKGPGQKLAQGDLAIADDLGRTWRSNASFENTYVLGQPPYVFQVGLNGLGKALVGVPVGSRVAIVLPAAESFGAVSTPPPGVRRTDTAVLVMDLVGLYKPNQGPSGKTVSHGGGALPTVSGSLESQPLVKIPHSPPARHLVVKTLVRGDGPPIAREQLVITQYVGVDWRTGSVFSSSWQRHTPAAYLLGSGQAIPAWEAGLPGVRIGSRVLMVVPPSDGYGSKGNPSLGIRPTDTVVFVVDVLGSYGT